MGGRRWTEKEIRFVKDNAGCMTEGEIAKRLKRSEAAVAQMVHRLREDGTITTSVRAWRGEARECPECHLMRHRFMRSGVCRVCHQRAHVTEYRQSIEAMVDGLPESRKDDIESLSINSKPLPKPPKKPFRADYEKTVFDGYGFKRDMDAYDAAMEERELLALNREWDALRRRKKTVKKWIDG